MTPDRLFAPGLRGFSASTMTVVAVAAYNNLSVGAALPAIGEDLGSLELLPWVVTVELITSAIATLAIGPVIDGIGTRRIYRVSLVAFAITCVACAVAPTMGALVAARAAQGLAGGAIIANVMAAIGLGVPEPLRARAYAINSSVWGVMGLAGPALAAVVVTVAGWPAIFLINLPVAFGAAVVGWNHFPGPVEEGRVRADWRGLLLLTVFTVLTLVGFSIPGVWTAVAAVGSLALIAVYVVHERRTEPPVLRVRHLASSQFRRLHLIAVLAVVSGIGSNSFLTLYVKGTRGFTTGAAAFTVLFLTVGWTTGAIVSSKLVEWRSSEFAVRVGAVVLTIGVTGAVVVVAADLPVWLIFIAYTLVGYGLGAVSSSILIVLQAKAKPAEMGRLISAHQFVRTLGFSYGAAIAGAALFGVVVNRLGDADEVRDLLSDEVVVTSAAAVEALRDGFLLAVVVSAVFGWVALAFALQLQEEPAPVGA